MHAWVNKSTLLHVQKYCTVYTIFFPGGPADHVILKLVGKCVHMLMDGVLKSGCQSRYKQKLEPVGLQLCCVPYLESFTACRCGHGMS